MHLTPDVPAAIVESTITFFHFFIVGAGRNFFFTGAVLRAGCFS